MSSFFGTPFPFIFFSLQFCLIICFLLFIPQTMAKEEAKNFCLYESLNTPMVEEGGKHTARVVRFLKPCAENISQAARFPRRSLPHNGQEGHPTVHFKGWKNPPRKWGDWIENMAGKHGYTWNQTGICDALLSSMYEIRCNPSLILGLVEYWCPESNTFVFPWGEATITLEDVMILGGFSVLGEPVNLPLTGDLVAMEAELLSLWRVMGRGKCRRDHRTWMKFFMDEEESHDLEHVGFLSLWLSRFAFPSLPEAITGTHVFPIAIHLSQGTRMALAPAVLASLFENLRLLKQQVASSEGESATVLGPFQLVQLWAMERFPILASKSPIELKPGEPRAARWHRLISNASVSLLSSALKSARDFQWRPFAADLKNWCFVSPYRDNEQLVVDISNSAEELRSFGQCLCADELVGLGGCIEKYMPYRVAMQFGMDQHLPGEFAVMDPSYSGHFSFYVPARSYKPCVSLEYLNWWRASRLIQEKEGEIKGMASKNDPYYFHGLNNAVGHFKGLLSEQGKQKHAAGTSDNPLDVEDYACTIVGTSSQPIDVDKYM